MHSAWSDFSGSQMTLDATEENVSRILFAENLQMSVKAMTIHFNVESASIAFRTDFYLSALSFRSQS
jgi:hypothetical protein